MNYDDRRGNLHIHFQPGTYHMNGQQALEYARFRHDPLGDIGRIHRQQELIKSALQQAVRPGNWGGIQKACQAFLKDVSVSVSPESPRHAPPAGFDQIMSAMGFLSRLSPEQIRFYEVPAVECWVRGMSCLRPNYSGTKLVLEQVFRDYAPIGWEQEKEEAPGATSTAGEEHVMTQPH
jgi:anionic cell wall polymer biosynthesis LytR-Cps2A-Psr (LCP) family protein